MAPLPFLSDDWIEAARAIHAELGDEAPVPSATLRMNLVVTAVPFGSGTVDAHVDTTAGALDIETGHLDEPDLTVTLDYDTAKRILVDQEPQAGMQAFLTGRISVDGDLTRLIVLLGQPPDEHAAEVATRMRDITA